ncbi:ATP-binding protein [Actinacidiphila sp. bgisy144]|uniref:ATP-binding protein n=1 Tax=unclassified Actinacidiphila TaxID=2995708 RepID=UPI003EBADBFE
MSAPARSPPAKAPSYRAVAERAESHSYEVIARSVGDAPGFHGFHAPHLPVQYRFACTHGCVVQARGRRRTPVPRFHASGGVTLNASSIHWSRLNLTCEPSAVRYARTHAREALERWGAVPDAVADALTIVSELTGNAVRHAGGSSCPPEPRDDRRSVRECSLALCASLDSLHITMRDASDQPPILRPLSGEAQNGRGLHLVAALSHGVWGYHLVPHGKGKVVWAQLRLLLPTAPPVRPDELWEPHTRRRIARARGTRASSESTTVSVARTIPSTARPHHHEGNGDPATKRNLTPSGPTSSSELSSSARACRAMTVVTDHGSTATADPHG